MRLLNAATMKFHEFDGAFIPPYAILSHRWEDHEVTFQELKSDAPAAAYKAGYKKIHHCCQQALKDRLHFVWVDTCCIDKTSSAELSEAINSMYVWYQRSTVCYAYLSDVQLWASYNAEDADGIWVTQKPETVLHVMNSRWWTRGWTLQELLAPISVVFYAHGPTGWSKIGTKTSLLELVARRTGIDRGILRGLDVKTCSIATRMSWASKRETTRAEDLAYCLLGIFGVNMPLLYGEGNKAFIRLQEEIMKQSDDQTLFAWQLGFEGYKDDICGPLATHPSKFSEGNTLVAIPDSASQMPFSMTNKGLRIELPIVHKNDERYGMAILHCSTANSFPKQIGLPVVRLGDRGSTHYARDARYIGPLGSFDLEFAVSKAIFMKQEPEQKAAWRTGLLTLIPTGNTFFSPVCWSADVAALKVNPDARAEYLVPASCRQGAILFAGQDKSHLLVLFNIEMQHVERFACKVIYSPPSFSRKFNNVSSTQRLVQELANTIQTAPRYRNALGFRGSDKAYTRQIFAEQVAREAAFSLVDSDYRPSNSRCSFDYLPNDQAVYANIGLQTLHEQITLVLDIQFQDRSDSEWRPCELDGTPIPSKNFAPSTPEEDIGNYVMRANDMTLLNAPNSSYI